jgi:hypothetical protein
VGRVTVVLLGVMALVAAACSSSTPAAAPVETVPETTTSSVLPTTATTARATTTTSGPPRTTVTTIIAMGPGDAGIGGTVLGPAGPVDGATVRVERIVGKTVVTADVTSSGGGSWQLGSILGGSYRVRAFKPPDLAQSAVEAFFLAANERRTIDFRLAAAGGERITAAVAPSPPRVDQPATVTVQVGTGRVDDQGRPSIAPRPGVPLTLTPGAGIVLESAPQVVTDANGAAAWRIHCLIEGAAGLTLTIGNAATQVKIPACAAVAPAPTAAATTTTRRG